MDRYWISRAGLQKAGGDPSQFSQYFGFCKVLQGDPSDPDKIFIAPESVERLARHLIEQKIDLRLYSGTTTDEACIAANLAMLAATYDEWHKEMFDHETPTQATQKNAETV